MLHLVYSMSQLPSLPFQTILAYQTIRTIILLLTDDSLEVQDPTAVKPHSYPIAFNPRKKRYTSSLWLYLRCLVIRIFSYLIYFPHDRMESENKSQPQYSPQRNRTGLIHRKVCQLDKQSH